MKYNLQYALSSSIHKMKIVSIVLSIQFNEPFIICYKASINQLVSNSYVTVLKRNKIYNGTESN